MAIRRPDFHDEFEGEIWDMFEPCFESGLISLKGGTRNRLCGKQVDVHLDYDSLRVIFECKSGESANIHDEIDILYSTIAAVKRNSPRKRVEGVLVTDRKYDSLTAADFERAGAKNVRLWYAEKIRYYENLASTLSPKLAFKSLVKDEFRYIARSKETFTVPAIVCKKAGRTAYSCLIKAEDLLEIAYVFRASFASLTENEEAYQRFVSKTRLEKIAKEIERKGIETDFPNSIIINFEEKVEFEPECGSLGMLTIPMKYGSAWVIDGQHRLFAFCKVSDPDIAKSFEFFVTAFQDLTVVEQARLFRTINGEQKDVNANLLDYLISKEEGDPRCYAARAALQLQDKGIFDKRINCGISGGGWITLHTMTRALTEYRLVTSKGGVAQTTRDDYQTPARLLQWWFEEVKEANPGNWRRGRKGFLQTNNGVAIMIFVLGKILQYETDGQSEDLPDLDRHTLRHYAKRLHNYRFRDDWREFGEESKRKEAARVILGRLNRAIRV